MGQGGEIHVDAMQYKVINRTPLENGDVRLEIIRRLYEIFSGSF